MWFMWNYDKRERKACKITGKWNIEKLIEAPVSGTYIFNVFNFKILENPLNVMLHLN